MKVLLINGSPHQNGCTFTALSQISEVLNQEKINTEIFQLGTQPISGCIACGRCRQTGFCVLDELVKTATDKAIEADGIIIGSPVHYAAASGSVTSFLDRLFYSASSLLAGKPAASIVSARRAGTTAALDQLNKYFTINSMPVVSSTYWNMVHGSTPEDVRRDAEGIQTLNNLARNMAWLLRCIEAGKKAGVPSPVIERGQRTNFIR